MPTNEYIISQLEKLIAELKTPRAGGGEKAPSSPPAASSSDGWVEHECRYWAVKSTQKGNSMGSFGALVDGEKVFFKCFKDELLVKYDPNKGSRWLLKLKPWNDTHVIEDMRPAGKPHPADEIPF